MCAHDQRACLSVCQRASKNCLPLLRNPLATKSPDPHRASSSGASFGGRAPPNKSSSSCFCELLSITGLAQPVLNLSAQSLANPVLCKQQSTSKAPSRTLRGHPIYARHTSRIIHGMHIMTHGWPSKEVSLTGEVVPPLPLTTGNTRGAAHNAHLSNARPAMMHVGLTSPAAQVQSCFHKRHMRHRQRLIAPSRPPFSNTRSRDSCSSTHRLPSCHS